jgi:hypothetical protein
MRELLCMREHGEGFDPVPEDSPWHPNWRVDATSLP